MNSINIVGRLTADPELRRTGDNTAVCSISVAVKRPRVKDTTDFIECVVWRQSAEYLHQYGHKGDVVAVSGSLQARTWKDKEGNNRKAWEVVAESVELLSSNKDSKPSTSSNQYANPYQGGNSGARSYPQQSFGSLPADTKLPWD